MRKLSRPPKTSCHHLYDDRPHFRVPLGAKIRNKKPNTTSAIMDHLSKSKAGPSQVPHSWFQEGSNRRGLVWSLTRSLSVLVIFLLGYAALIGLSPDKKWKVWDWNLQGSQDDKTGHYDDSDGSQYLLGVGKADITG